jgi:shikimate dehydrogenase
MRFGLLGERLSHSFSPLIHAELGGYEYKLYEKKPAELEVLLRHGDFDGLNVTVPYKCAVMPFCAGLSESACAVGSVNTLTRLADGSLFGDNTDCYGFEYLLRASGINPARGKTVVLGSGGSSLAVQAALKNMRAAEVVVISRCGADNYGNIANHSDAALIINTTPVGMYPACGTSPLADLSVFKNCQAVVDLIYNPARTELLLQAEERGLLAVGGLLMLVAQAKASAEIFTCAQIPDAQIERIARKIERLTRNTVLIGMPGCGKSTVGAALAKKMNVRFADTDEYIVKAAGKSIPAIFAEDGEAAFRTLERDALERLCQQKGIVIATGGGVVKCADNKRTVRQGGIVVHLDRALDQLSVSGRPLSERDGIARLAAERLPLYKQWADFTIPVHSVEQAAAAIFNQLCGGH